MGEKKSGTRSTNLIMLSLEKNLVALPFFVNYIKSNDNIKKILDLGSGHGRDSIFFALKGLIEVEAIDYSVVAVEILTKIAMEKRLSIKSQVFDIKKEPLPYPDEYFDREYSHLLLNMRFICNYIQIFYASLRGIYYVIGGGNKIR